MLEDDKIRQDGTRQDKSRQDKTGHKARQAKPRQVKTSVRLTVKGAGVSWSLNGLRLHLTNLICSLKSTN